LLLAVSWASATVCELVASCNCCSPSIFVVDGSFVSITLDDDSSKEGVITGKIIWDEELSVTVSISLLIGAVSVGGIAWVALSIAVGRSLSSIWDV
jgi:hypothetical protein